ncbi:carboxypeptidase M32 [Verrucomicrobiaceae bacterium N1E253]|uniref:Metal-dependent carboxypeptidase n=1 Tax=Oceaniferula marina TaxID=2748318 RepID=A0A851GC85_9BACT|nr:carboxypeptidase M32 [Oceaniferula marina]NWK54789.1 carboxypeptidase M32 [Oceaniferula marina]
MSATAYQSLCQKSREIALLGNTMGVLGWDQETYMPKGGVQYRAKQLAWLSGKVHELSTSSEFQQDLEAAENGTDGKDLIEAANLREFRHQFNRATKLPQSLVERASEAASLAKVAWAESREKSDFTLFAPHLSILLDIAREKADRWGYEDEPYDALLSNYERAAKTSEVAAMFDSVAPELADIAREAVKRSAETPNLIPDTEYPIEQQQQLNREIAEDIGFDFNKGRIDTTTHPFCTGIGPKDTRLTTRYLLNDFTSSLFGVLHEAGHGLYDQGLPEDQHGLPVGDSSSLGIHESQSRLWENHVGRSRPFWSKWLPRAQEIFPQLSKLDLDGFLTSINRAETSFIRVESDEATYDLHILLRFGIEREILNGSIAVNDIPEAWNSRFEKLMGMTPPNDGQGCLQDIHWAMGGLGYFATYTLGNFNAAQLHHRAMQDQKVASAFNQADFIPLLNWMRTHIHNHGCTYLPQDLIERASGQTTTPQYHIDHLKQRYL